MKKIFSQSDVIYNFNKNINLFKTKKDRIKSYEPSDPPPEHLIFQKIMDSKQSFCLRGRHMLLTEIITEHEKLNLASKKVMKVRIGKCDNCGRNKSQGFSPVNDKRPWFWKNENAWMSILLLCQTERGVI